jgi:hypothetical protein
VKGGDLTFPEQGLQGWQLERGKVGAGLWHN